MDEARQEVIDVGGHQRCEGPRGDNISSCWRSVFSWSDGWSAELGTRERAIEQGGHGAIVIPNGRSRNRSLRVFWCCWLMMRSILDFSGRRRRLPIGPEFVRQSGSPPERTEERHDLHSPSSTNVILLPIKYSFDTYSIVIHSHWRCRPEEQRNQRAKTRTRTYRVGRFSNQAFTSTSGEAFLPIPFPVPPCTNHPILCLS